MCVLLPFHTCSLDTEKQDMYSHASVCKATCEVNAKSAYQNAYIDKACMLMFSRFVYHDHHYKVQLWVMGMIVVVVIVVNSFAGI